MPRTEYISNDPSDTILIGETIGRNAKAGELYTVYGDLGAGKTQLVKGIARGLDIADWEYVVSPSFTLMNIYEGRITLCHVDLYRLENVDVPDLDIEEFLAEGIVVVEWAQRASWQDDATQVYIEICGEKERKIVIINQENQG